MAVAAMAPATEPAAAVRRRLNIAPSHA
jgi:hypothetical protein